MSKPPAIKMRGFRQAIPAGYMVGRTDPKTGAVQLIDRQGLRKFLGLSAAEVDQQIANSGQGDLTIKDEGSVITNPTSIINFVGTGVTVTDVSGTATVTIPGAVTPASTAFHPGFVSGRYYINPFGASPSSFAPTANKLCAMPFYAPYAQTFTEIAINVTVAFAGSSVRLGAYTSVNGLPAALIADAGAVATTSTGIRAITGASIPIPLGWSWLVADFSSSNTNVTNDTNAGWFQGIPALDVAQNGRFFGAATFGALPSTFGAVTYDTTGPIRIGLRY